MQNFIEYPKRKNESVLMPYLSVISDMRNQKISFRLIKEYLETEYKIKCCSIQNLSKFYERHKATLNKNENQTIPLIKQQKESSICEDVNMLTNKTVLHVQKNNQNSSVLDHLRKIQTPVDEQGIKLETRRKQK